MRRTRNDNEIKATSCLYKEIALQNAVSYKYFAQSAVLSLAKFSEFEGENSLPKMLFPG